MREADSFARMNREKKVVFGDWDEGERVIVKDKIVTFDETFLFGFLFGLRFL